MIRKQCIAFFFSEDRERVLLKKNTDGFFDGIYCDYANVRDELIKEFYFSTCIRTESEDWLFLKTECGDGIYFGFGDPFDALTVDDPVEVFSVHNLDNYNIEHRAKRLIGEVLEMMEGCET